MAEQSLENSDSFLLEWKDFSSTFMSNLAEFYRPDDHQDLADVSLISAPGSKIGIDSKFKSFSAHKLVLSAGSDYFKALFQNLKEEYQQQPSRSVSINPVNPVIVLNDIASEDLECVLEFLYRGKVSVEEKRMKSFLKVAENLRIRGLCEGQQQVQETSTSLTKSISHPPSVVSLPSTTSKNRKRARKRNSCDSNGENTIKIKIKTETTDDIAEEEEENAEVDSHFVAVGAEQKNGNEKCTAEVERDKKIISSGSSNDILTSSERKKPLVVLFGEKGRCHFCHLLCQDRQSLKHHLQSVHQPPRHALCENCENFFHVCAIQRHKMKCAESYRSRENE